MTATSPMISLCSEWIGVIVNSIESGEPSRRTREMASNAPGVPSVASPTETADRCSVNTVLALTRGSSEGWTSVATTDGE